MKYICLIAIMIGSYLVGHADGEALGAQRADARAAQMKSEHDRVMQFVGVCKWSQIMADDIRCKQELP